MDVAGQRLLAYPALLDEEASVALRLLASREAADAATQGGLRRLVLLALSTTLARLEQQVPASPALTALATGTPGAGTAPRRQIALRALDEAFGLESPARFPRSRAAFAELVVAGRPRLPAAIASLVKLAQEIGAELTKAQATLRGLVGKPGAPRAQLDDVRTQLAELAPPDLLARTPRERLAHLPRYLRAVLVRLDRLPNGPQKDLAKAEQVLPFWRDWLDKRAALRARGVPEEELASFRWLIEELRVSLFAPELRAAVPVSPQRLTEQWRAMAR